MFLKLQKPNKYYSTHWRMGKCIQQTDICSTKSNWAGYELDILDWPRNEQQQTCRNASCGNQRLTAPNGWTAERNTISKVT